MIRRWFKAAVAAVLAAGMLAFASPASAQKAEPTTKIDELLKKSWADAEVKPSERANDYMFVRRVFIDLIGRIPSAEEVREFIADSAPNKRQKLVRKLLHQKPTKENPKLKDYTEEYAQHWSNVWTVWLMTRGGLMEQYHNNMRFWLENEFTANTPHDKMVRKLLTATGKTNDNGSVAFILSHMGEKSPADKQITDGPYEMVPLTSRVTKIFLGVQTQCTQCHDHPFNPEWGQENFWGVNAFFRQVTRDKTPTPRSANLKKEGYVAVNLLDDASANKSGTVYYEKRSGVLVSTKPVFLADLADLDKDDKTDRKDKHIPPDANAKSRRDLAADFVIGHDNFAKAYVNRIWAHLFGRGMNETPTFDDFGNHNKVVHKELLDELASAFKTYGHDPKQLLEWICTSDAYGLSYVANDSNKAPAKEAYFSRMLLKSMSPEVLFESLMEATRSEAAMSRDEKKETKDRWKGRLVTNFGDDEGNEIVFNGTIVQALLMMNGKEMTEALNRKGTGTVDKAIAKHKANDNEIIKEIYLCAVGRPMGALNNIPLYDKKTGKVSGSTSEQSVISAALKEAKSAGKTHEFYTDLFWSLLNTNEFILNH